MNTQRKQARNATIGRTYDAIRAYNAKRQAEYEAHLQTQVREQQTLSKCDSCDSATVNGVFCHERGCPRIGQVYRDGEWLRTYTCRECGNTTTDEDEAERCCNESEYIELEGNDSE